jgi:cytochrome c biogenesis protein CcdA
MLRLIGIVVSIGIADSLNPTTIGPALYMAEGKHAVSRVVEFTAAVFAVYLVGGLAIALGPGELILDLAPRPSHDARHIIEIVAGASMLVGAAVLWHRRNVLPTPERRGHGRERERGSSAILGATITAVELPTAFPYFAAIAAVVGSGISGPREIFLLVLFNVCFVLPLIAIALLLALAGDNAAAMLTQSRDGLRANWPKLLAAVALLAGLFVVLLGFTGLFAHRAFGRFMRRRVFGPFGLGRLAK